MGCSQNSLLLRRHDAHPETLGQIKDRITTGSGLVQQRTGYLGLNKSPGLDPITEEHQRARRVVLS